MIYKNCVISIERCKRSLLYMSHKVGASIEPCRTPTLIDFSFKLKNCISSFKWELMRESNWPDIPHAFNFTERISWFTQSSAFVKSRRSNDIEWFLQRNSKQSETTCAQHQSMKGYFESYTEDGERLSVRCVCKAMIVWFSNNLEIMGNTEKRR